MSRRPAGRALTFVAAGFLFLDAVLLALAAYWAGRWALLFWALVFALGGLGVIRLWRRYTGALADLDRARRALRDEVDRIQQTLHPRSD